jgi:uncharacterized membrane protein YdjX (TVP38/TMEM64 family)
LEYLITLAEWLQAHPQISGLVFVLVFALILVVGVPGGNFMMLSSGMLFGAVKGAALAVTGAMLAAWLTNLFIRTAFGKWLDQRAGKARASVRRFVESGNGLLLVVPRLVPVIPFFAINVALTAAGVPRKSYLVSTLIGVVPIAALFAQIGSELPDLDELSGVNPVRLITSPDVYLPLAALMLLTVLGWVFIRMRDRA